MDRTNRDIVDSFVPKLPTDYAEVRLESGDFVGQVPGYLGLLTRAAAKAQFVDYQIPLWDFSSTDPLTPDEITIQIRAYVPMSALANPTAEDLYFDSVPGFVVKNIVNPPDPFIVSIPEAYLPNGVWLVRYRQLNPDSNVGNVSVAQLLVIDETAPYERTGNPPPAPSLPSIIPPGPVDRTYFQSQPNQTAFFPFIYLLEEGLSPGDTYEVFVGSSTKPITFADGTTRKPIDLTRPIQIEVPLSAILAETRGNYDVRYVVYDSVGNRSLESYSLTLTDVGDIPAPTGFLPAIVELADVDGLIHSDDVTTNSGLRVRIPPYLNPVRPTDPITVVLTSVHGSIPLTQPVGATGFPTFQFTPANMATLYGAGPGTVPVTATWVVTRGTPLPTPPLSTAFGLNLEPVGPDLVADLLPIVVQAVRPGGTFGPVNNLELQDVNRDAVFRIPLWTTDRTPEVQLPLSITVTYGGRVYTQDVTSIPAGREVIIPLPFSDILALGGPTQPVFYTINRPGNPNSVSKLPPETVTVSSAVLQMDAPTSPNSTGIYKTTGCNSLTPINTGVLKVFIPGSEYLSLSEPVVVTYIPFQNDNNTAPALPPVVKSFNLPSDSARRVGFTVDFGTALELFNPVHSSRALANIGSATLSFVTQYNGRAVSSLTTTIRVRGRIAGAAGVSYYCAGGIIP